MTDQSIQCDFPIVVRNCNSTRKLRNHHTSVDINMPNRTLQNSWVQLRPAINRPKSLNLMSTETFHRSKISFHSEGSPMSRTPTYPSNSTISLQNMATRERTPPMSSAASSIVLSQFKTYPFKVPSSSTTGKHVTMNCDSLESMTSTAAAGGCKCLCEDEYSNNQRFVTGNTPEGLSWRRLHMSRAKLKATATTSELLSGFAMVAMVELQINEPTNVPEWLFVMFAICTTVLVSVHIFALMISTYILPNIDAISKLDICELVAESPHERMRGFIELAWAFSTVLGLFLFLVEVAILCWVKFWDYSFNAAIAATVVVIPVLVIFILFAVHFYHSLVVYRCDTSRTDMEKLEDMRKHLDKVDNPV